MGGWEGGGGVEGAGGKLEAGQVETVVGKSLTPVTSLLVPPTGPTDPVLHHGGLTGSAISLQ